MKRVVVTKLHVILVAVLLWLLVISPVRADVTANVTVLATPMVAEGIIDFTATYVSDYQVDLSWSFADNVTSIIIMMGYDEYPEDIPDIYTAPSDGYLVYSGSATSFSDTHVDLAGLGVVKYAAFGVKDDGTYIPYSGAGTEGFMSISWFFLVVVALAVALTWMSFKSRPMVYLVNVSAMFLWMGIMFWWWIDPPYADFDLPDVLSYVLTAVTLMLSIGLALDIMNRANQTEISREKGGHRWTEWGTPPKGELSGYEKYKRQLQGRTRR